MKVLATVQCLHGMSLRITQLPYELHLDVSFDDGQTWAIVDPFEISNEGYLNAIASLSEMIQRNLISLDDSQSGAL